jgi:hypothetical protein
VEQKFRDVYFIPHQGDLIFVKVKLSRYRYAGNKKVRKSLLTLAIDRGKTSS